MMISQANNGLKLVRGQVDSIINGRKKELENKKDEGFDETAATDLLGIMLAARDDQGKPVFDNENLVDQVTHSTDALSLFFAFRTLFLVYAVVM
jgi:cytochrome P450